MKSLYLILDIGTILFPLLLSFDTKVAFVKQWLSVLIASAIVGIPFIIWDYYFTYLGVWGFNSNYLIGFNLGNLPIEEVLFFVVVPFACTFIYACCKVYFIKIRFNLFNLIFYCGVLLYLIFIAIYGYNGSYSISVIFSTIVTLLILRLQRKKLHYFPVSFVIALVPFFLVNGVLTGGFTEAPIVWYNDLQRTPFRFFTIPIEDVLYGFTLLGLNVAVFEKINPRN